MKTRVHTPDCYERLWIDGMANVSLGSWDPEATGWAVWDELTRLAAERERGTNGGEEW